MAALLFVSPHLRSGRQVTPRFSRVVVVLSAGDQQIDIQLRPDDEDDQPSGISLTA